MEIEAALLRSFPAALAFRTQKALRGDAGSLAAFQLGVASADLDSPRALSGEPIAGPRR